MNDNTSIAIVLGLFFVSISGCCIMQEKYSSDVMIEREKTKQAEIKLESQRDSLRLYNIKQNGKRN